MKPITSKKQEKTGRLQSHFQYFANTVVYHQKQGTPTTNVTEEDIKGMNANESIRKSKFGTLDLEEVSSATSKKDLISMCKNKKVDPRDVPKLVMSHAIVKENTDQVIIKEVTSLNPIQEFILEYASFSNDRIVIWIADEKGLIGKSYISTYMTKHHNTVTLSTTSYTGAIRALKNKIEQRGQPDTIIIDLARASFTEKTEDSVYNIIETLKAQYITATKYDSSIIEQTKVPTVLIMSNALPDIKRLSDDRWVVLVSGILPDTFDYAFAGSMGKVSLNVFTEYVNSVKELNKEELSAYKVSIPIKTIIDIDSYPEPDYLSLAYRKSCWDRGFFPIFSIKSYPPSKSHPKGRTEIILSEEQLSAEEIAEYDEWKTNIKTSTNPIISDMIICLRQQAEVKLEEKRRLIREAKQLSITHASID